MLCPGFPSHEKDVFRACCRDSLIAASEEKGERLEEGEGIMEKGRGEGKTPDAITRVICLHFD